MSRFQLFSLILGVFVWSPLVQSDAHANMILLSDDFSAGSVSTTFRAYENTINTGWRKAPGYGSVVESAWTISGGQAQNASSASGTGYPMTQPSETPLFNFFSSSATDETHLTLMFEYSIPNGDSLFAHLWGYTGVLSAPSGFVSNIEASHSGNMNVAENAAGSTLDGFNLTDGATSGYGSALSAISGELTGSGTFSTTFRVADLGIPGVSTAGDLDFFLLQFGKDEDGLAGTTSIDNVTLVASTIPEPSSLLLMFLSGISFWVYRRTCH